MVVRNCRSQWCQELRWECVGTISGRILLHRHVCCTQVTTRYGLHSEQNNQPAGVATSPKKRFCLASSLCFSCAHDSLHVCVSFCTHMFACDIHQYDPGQRASYDLPYGHEWVEHGYVQEPRWDTAVHGTCTGPCKMIFSYVRTQETQINHRTESLLWVWIQDQRDWNFDHTEKHDGLGRVWNYSICE